ncbi:hypothetical protein [Hungatella hathewayi]|uniref:hypothetical protein n=1 Tax=Hungatella hathewayi TaxID=154046 RepID=UPI000555BCBC|nr:hypothetical protein [Hungatella hathewayi]
MKRTQKYASVGMDTGGRALGSLTACLACREPATNRESRYIQVRNISHLNGVYQKISQNRSMDI